MVATIAPVVVLLALVISAPWLLRRGKPTRFQRVQQAAAVARGAMLQVRSGLQVFRKPKLGGWAALMQLTAWAIQWLACYVLLVALGLDDQRRDRRRGGGAVRGERDGGAAGHAVEPGRLPGGLRGRAVGLRRGQDERARLRDHPPGGRDRDRGGMGMPALVREGMTWRICACGRCTPLLWSSRTPLGAVKLPKPRPRALPFR